MTAASPADIRIRPIRSDNVWGRLSAGRSDLWMRPAIGLGYGLFVSLLSYPVPACRYFFNRVYLLLPLTVGFMFGRPIIAIGRYEMNRRSGEDKLFGLTDLVCAVRRAPLQLAYMGMVLLLLALFWLRIARLLFALSFDSVTPLLATRIESLFLSMQGLTFHAVATAIGAILAFTACAISAVSISLLVDREADADRGWQPA